LADWADVEVSHDFVDGRDIVIAVITKKQDFVIPEKVDSFKILDAVMKQICNAAQEKYENGLVKKTAVNRVKFLGIEILKKTKSPNFREYRLLGFIKWKRKRKV
jgi:hypothetical protein